MEPPAVSPPPPDSHSNSSEEEPPPPSAKLRLMCSSGGHIIPRPHDKVLCYIGGDTRMVVVDRHAPLSHLRTRLSNKPFTLKYQLPNEDLDSLITISSHDDLLNMIDEYDRLDHKAPRLRLFLFPDKPDSELSSIHSFIQSSTKSEDWFFEALNGVKVASNQTAYSESNSSVNCLLGLAGDHHPPPDHQNGRRDFSENNQNNVVDGNSVPDSPMLSKTSSFGSESSLPSMANLPPVRLRVEENGQGQRGGGVLGIEEQFHQMSVGVAGAGSSPPAPGVGAGVVGGGGECVNRVVSADERLDQGVAVGYRMVPQLQHQVQPQQQHHQHLPEFQQKGPGFVDFPSPDSVSSDGSVTNPSSRQRQMVYQEQIMHRQSANNRAGANVVVVDQKINDPNNRGQMQQPGQESEYVMPSVYEQHPQLHQQQFVQGGVQYIHSHTAGGVPIASYYPMYHSQQQHHPHNQGSEQQFVYYAPPAASRPVQAYSMPVQQQGYGESPTSAQASRPQAPQHPSASVNPAAVYNAVPPSKPEMAAGVYRTSGAGAPQLMQVQQSSPHHPQYVGYQIHHPSQSIRPPGTSANYAYEYAEPTQAQMYYTQPISQQMTAQYQTATSSPMVMLSGNASQFPSENVKQQNSNSQL